MEVHRFHVSIIKYTITLLLRSKLIPKETLLMVPPKGFRVNKSQQSLNMLQINRKSTFAIINIQVRKIG